MKTGDILPMTTRADVKTEKLPCTYQRKGNWYFRCKDAHVPLTGSYGDPDFLGHYYELCRVFKVGPVPNDPRSVYFMGWQNGPIKIGLADNVRVRRETLQVACPYDLEILAVTTGGLRVELEYHRKFGSQRLRGEWFERCPEIEAEIERINMTRKASTRWPTM